MNKVASWVLIGLICALAAVISWFTVGWFLPLVLAVAAVAALLTAVILASRAKRKS